jgi:hypothetical protein
MVIIGCDFHTHYQPSGPALNLNLVEYEVEGCRALCGVGKGWGRCL